MSVGDAIYKLRTRVGMSQEKFANLFGVSRQSMQKWESGTFKPDIDKLVAIAKHFGVSVDSLLFDNVNPEITTSIPEAFENSSEIDPGYGELYGWIPYFNNLEREYRQCEMEGLDISQYRELFMAVSKLPVTPVKNKIAKILFQVTMRAPRKPDYKYNEPSRLEGIRMLTQRYRAEGTVTKERLKDKIYGAWLGRCCGAYAGYVIEGIFNDELVTLLKLSGNYPMQRYIVSEDFSDKVCSKIRFEPIEERFVDKMKYMRCSDINYAVLSSVIIDTAGRGFTSYDVARLWLSSLPRDAYHGDERIVFRNLICGYYPPNSAIYENPYRESITAWVRADYYGYINPGDPETAAEMAWRDASVSNVKNGIYGSMFVAAMLACAAVTDDIREIIYGGLSQIPSTSRLYERVMNVVREYDGGKELSQFYTELHRRYQEDGEPADWSSIFPNAEIVVAALLYGGGDFGDSLCVAAQAAFDTDCNTAIVGSILGMKLGEGGIPAKWRAPSEKLIDSGVLGIGRVSVEEMAERTLKHIE